MGGFDQDTQKRERILPGQLLTALLTVWIVPLLVLSPKHFENTKKNLQKSKISSVRILNPDINMEFKKMGISPLDNLYFTSLIEQKNEKRIHELNVGLLEELPIWSRQSRPVIKNTDLKYDLNRDGDLSTQDFKISVRLMKWLRNS
jgi:hypothetical protein